MTGTCTIDTKTALVFGGFSQRQSQLITLSGDVRVDLASVPKFTQQIRRCYSIDTFTNKDSFKEVYCAKVKNFVKSRNSTR